MTSVTAPVSTVARVLIAHVCKEDSGALGTKADRRRRFARAKPPPHWSWFHPPLKRMKACGSALLPLTDNMAAGHHAAVSAGVRPGGSVVVIGDGAVGLC